MPIVIRLSGLSVWLLFLIFFEHLGKAAALDKWHDLHYARCNFFMSQNGQQMCRRRW